MKNAIIIITLLLLSGLCAADSLNVSLAGHLDLTGSANYMCISGSYAYIADQEGGLSILDITAPTSPFEVGYCDLPEIIFGIYIEGDYAYLAEDGGIRIIDISVPSSPVEVGSLALRTNALSISLFGSYAYVGGWMGLYIIDVSTPSLPSEVGLYSLDCVSEIGIVDSLAYMISFRGHIVILDISTPLDPIEIDGLSMPDRWLDGYDISGDCIFIACAYHHDLTVIRNAPGFPFNEAGHLDLPGNGRDVSVSRPWAYLTGDSCAIRVIDVSIPSMPCEAGFYESPGSGRNIEVVGDYAFVTCGDLGLYVYDISYFTGIEEGDAVRPGVLALSAYPNPFNSACRISAPEGAEIEIFDINGRSVAEFGGGDQIWKPEASVGSGIYLVRARFDSAQRPDGATVTKRVVYLK